jgi:LacI family transcriptional regulator
MSPASTLREVAKMAGVSVSTASQALHNRPNVAPETRMRVLEAAVALGYQQQVRLASPVSGKLSVVGLLTRTTPDFPLPVNPFYSYVLAGAERECQRSNLSLMYANVEVDAINRPLGLPPMLTDNKVDGVLVVGALLPETIAQIAQKPVVLVDAYAEGQVYDSVLSDNLSGAYEAVQHLIVNGHRHIGLIGSQPNAYPSIRERRKGYMRALKQHRITQTFIEDGALTRDSGYEDARRLLSRAPEVTAIFACNDNVAIGVIKAAEEMGRSVPDDLSVIGFDDIDLAREIKPALTTVHVDKLLMGEIAVRQLRDRVENPDRTRVTVTLSTHLVVRDTVRPLKPGGYTTDKDIFNTMPDDPHPEPYSTE